MLILTSEEIIELHESIITLSGGAYGIRDRGLLESAIFGCQQTFGGEELYPTVIEKSARLAYAICKNHPLIDGNKRTAVISMLLTLDINEIFPTYIEEEIFKLGLDIANDKVNCEGIVSWIKSHVH